ncbi:MAG TPA: TIGR03668 family PPOX class F420-dependent oxidoreductase [Candidatus Binatia bacterium]
MTRREKLFVQSARIAHLASADDKGRPHVIPICFAFDGKEIYSPIDEKPKKTSPLLLKRVRNIRANPHVAVVIDRYDDNWNKLAYVLISGRAQLLFRGARHAKAVRLLRKKYSQYEKMRLEERPIIQITIAGWTSWGVV